MYHYGFGQQISHDTYLTIIPLRSMEYSEQIFQWLWARQLDHMASCEQIISYLKLHNKDTVPPQLNNACTLNGTNLPSF